MSAYQTYPTFLSVSSAMYLTQGSAHTGREWSAPTTTQRFLPPLELKMAYFYHHSETIIVLKCYIQYNIIPFSLQLSHHSDHSGQNPADIWHIKNNLFRIAVAVASSRLLSFWYGRWKVSSPSPGWGRVCKTLHLDLPEPENALILTGQARWHAHRGTGHTRMHLCTISMHPSPLIWAPHTAVS